MKRFTSLFMVSAIATLTAFSPVYGKTPDFTIARGNFICSQSTGVNLRSGPGEHFRVITVLPRRTPVKIIRKQQGRDGKLWVYISANGRVGWVRTDFVC